MPYFVYMMTNKKDGTLYVGFTGNLVQRIEQHKASAAESFTKKYNLHTLVHYEEFADIQEAKYREKQLKWWRREWKNKLIETHNPNWEEVLVY